VPFIINFFYNAIAGLRGHRMEDSNPWEATTLDWAATTSPPLGHGNFAHIPVVYRGPYEYSVPGDPRGYIPQHIEERTIPPETTGGVLPEVAVAQREP
jgi:cytochrome c oxidase subunit I